MLLQENKLYIVVLICLSQHCTRKLPLCNVDPQPTNNVSQKKNIQLNIVWIYLGRKIMWKLIVQSWPRVHRYTFTENPFFEYVW